MTAGTTNVGFEEKLWQAADKLRSYLRTTTAFRRTEPIAGGFKGLPIAQTHVRRN